MGTKTASKLNLAQCIRLQQNNFLSSDMTTDYCEDEVVSRTILLQASRDSRKLDKMFREEKHRERLLNKSNTVDSDLPPPIPLEAMIDYVEEINF